MQTKSFNYRRILINLAATTNSENDMRHYELALIETLSVIRTKQFKLKQTEWHKAYSNRPTDGQQG